MLKKGVVLLVTFILLVSTVSAVDLDQVSDYAEQYEDGTLSYLKFKTYMYSIEKQFYDELDDSRQEFYLEDDKVNEKDSRLNDEIRELGKDAEQAFMEGDMEELQSIIEQLIEKFEEQGDDKAVELLKELSEAAANEDYDKIEDLAQKLPKDKFGGDDKDGYRMDGWDIEVVEEIFGEPTWYEYRVWVENENQDIFLDEPVPRFEKRLFDGEEIKITLNAWPNMIKDGEDYILFYHIGLETRIKQGEELDVQAIISYMEEKTEAYQSGDLSLQEFAQEAALQERAFHQYLWDNKEDCEDLFSGVLDEEENSDVVIIEGLLAENKNFFARINLQHEINSEWDNFNFWVHIESRERNDDWDSPEDDYNSEDMFGKSADDIWEEFSEDFVEMMEDVVGADSASEANKAFFSQERRLNHLLGELNWRANEEKGITVDELEDDLYDLIKEVATDVNKERMEKTRYRTYLIKETVQQTNTWCRSEDKECDSDEYCKDAECVSAKGGNEVCENGKDDDNDGYWDCEDPDCNCKGDDGRKGWFDDNDDNDDWDHDNDDGSYEESECKDGCEDECPGADGTDCINDQCKCYYENHSDDDDDDWDDDSGSDDNSGDDSSGEDDQSDDSGSGEADDSGQDDDSSGEDSGSDDSGGDDSSDNSGDDGGSDNSGGDSGSDDGGSSDSISGSAVDVFSEQDKKGINMFKLWWNVAKISTYSITGSAVNVFDDVGASEDGEESNDEPAEEPVEEPQEDNSNEEETVEEPVEETPEDNQKESEGTDDSEQEDGSDNEESDDEEVNEDWDEDKDNNDKDNDYNWFDDVDDWSNPCEDQCQECWKCDWETEGDQCNEYCIPCNLCQYEEGDYECHDNQQFNEEFAYCECDEGYSDCDGDWENGCELEGWCESCQEDSDCAPARCGEDPRRIITFTCEQGEGWEEDKEVLELGAECNVLSDGTKEAGFWIGGWGEELQDFEKYKQEEHQKGEEDWCKKELEWLTEERLMIQESFNDEFIAWFFNEFVDDNPTEFEDHMRMVHSLHRILMENTDRTAWSLECLGESEFPEEYQPIQVSYESVYGEIEIWEEFKVTDHFSETEINVLNPYMKIWIFPPKEFIVEKMKEEFGGPKGPPPHEIAEIKENKVIMKKINKISKRFDDGAEIKLQVVDNGEVLFQNLMKINPDIILRMQSIDESYSGSIDATVSVEMDFLYEMMSTIAKEVEGGHVEGPWWEERSDYERGGVEEAWIAIKVLGNIIVAVTNGEIDVEPDSRTDDIVFSLKEIVTMMSMGG
ncbi:MAG: hypothetical protein ABIG93_01380 [archaeon]|nr:hypothetical protein [Nanoarchaeota archaeon]